MGEYLEILSYIQGKYTHSVDVLLAMLELTEEKCQNNSVQIQSRFQIPRREICRWIKKNVAFISNATYDARRNELVSMGLLTTAKRSDSIGGRGEDLNRKRERVQFSKDESL